MRVREFIEWLSQFPDQEATVEVLECRDGSPYYQQGGVTRSADFDPALHAEYTDLRGNQFVKDDAPYKDRRALLLGLNEG